VARSTSRRGKHPCETRNDANAPNLRDPCTLYPADALEALGESPAEFGSYFLLGRPTVDDLKVEFHGSVARQVDERDSGGIRGDSVLRRGALEEI